MNHETCEPENPRQCNSIPGGDTRLKNYTPGYAMEFYLKTGVKHQKNPLTENFFSEENVLFITRKISEVLKKLTGGQNVEVPYNDELVQTMWEVAKSNIGLTYVPGAVAILNRAVIEHESTVLYNSLIRRKLWIKYYLTQDRMRVFPYGELTQQPKGEEVISPSGYMLSSPWARHRKNYLKQTQGICCDDNVEYKNIYGYLEPKKKPMGTERANQPVYEMGTVPRTPLQCYNDKLKSQLF